MERSHYKISGSPKDAAMRSVIGLQFDSEVEGIGAFLGTNIAEFNSQTNGASVVAQ
jgi:hypothetical protein